MKRLAIFLPLISSGALAHDPPPGTPATPTPATVNIDPRAVAGSDSRSTSSSTSTAVADAEAFSDSESASSASTGDSTSSSNSGGNTVTSSSVYKQQRQAPAVLTAATNTTAACSGEWHVGASVGLGGVSFGKSRTVHDCVLAEAAEREGDRGNLQASIQLRCQISYYRDALGNDCIALLNTQTTSVKEEKDYATKDYVDKAFKASVRK